MSQTAYSNPVDRTYSLHGLLSIKFSGSETVMRAADSEFGDLPDARSDTAKKSISLGVGTQVDLEGTPVALGEGIFYIEGRDAIILSAGKSTTLRPENVELVVEGNPLAAGNMSVSIATPLTVQRNRGVSAGVSETIADLKADTLPHLAKSKEERWTNMIITAVLEPLLYFTLPALGCTFVHGAGLARDGKGVLVIGHSGVGKTSLALEMVSDGYSFFGDDLVILSREGEMLSFPKRIKLEGWNITERPEVLSKIKEKMGTKEKLFFKMFRSYFKDSPSSISTTASIGDIIENPEMGTRSRLHHIVHVKRYGGSEFVTKDIPLPESVSETALNLFWEFENQDYRNVKLFYAFMRLQRQDHVGFLEEHHRSVSETLAQSFRDARSSIMMVPASATVGDTYEALGKLLRGA